MRSILPGPIRAARRAEGAGAWLLRAMVALALALFAGQADRSSASEAEPLWTMQQLDAALAQPTQTTARATQAQPQTGSGPAALPVGACVMPLAPDDALPQCIAPLDAADPKSAHDLLPEPRAPPFDDVTPDSKA